MCIQHYVAIDSKKTESLQKSLTILFDARHKRFPSNDIAHKNYFSKLQKIIELHYIIIRITTTQITQNLNE